MTAAHDPCCFYCEAVLSPRHEHDHFPIPKRHGGQDTACICINCHDLVDRVNLDTVDAATVLNAFQNIGPGLPRVLFMKMYRLMLDDRTE